MILVTGGAGFIGSNFVLDWLRCNDESVINLDALTYAGNLDNLEALKNDARHIFIHGDIGDKQLVSYLFNKYRPRAIVHFAAESHVDRSISRPDAFIKTNVNGTLNLLTCAKAFYDKASSEEKSAFRFLHVSTDEVYGSLESNEALFTEDSPYRSNSPYAASKAASDLLVRAWHQTYGLPVLITHCSNNYGPYQFPEKLIPLMITRALERKSLPIYGDGLNVRDWLFVGDHCQAIRSVLEKGKIGETYNIGGNCEKDNITMVKKLCAILDEVVPLADGPYEKLITNVPDRLGHDRRYAIDASKIKNELGFVPQTNFEEGLRQTVIWYLNHRDWLDRIASGQYRESNVL